MTQKSPVARVTIEHTIGGSPITFEAAEMDISYTPGSPIVGGEIIPVDRWQLLLPWAGGAALLLAAAVLALAARCWCRKTER